MENDNKVLVGVVVGVLAAIGAGVGAYLLCKTPTAKLLKRKYFNFIENLTDKNEEE